MRGCPVRLVLSLGALLLPPTLGAKAKPEELLQLTDDTLEAALASHPLMLVTVCADTCVPASRTVRTGYTYRRLRAAWPGRGATERTLYAYQPRACRTYRVPCGAPPQVNVGVPDCGPCNLVSKKMRAAGKELRAKAPGVTLAQLTITTQVRVRESLILTLSLTLALALMLTLTLTPTPNPSPKP